MQTAIISIMQLADIDPIRLAIPFFFLLIINEVIAGWIGRRSYYRLNDSIADLSTALIFAIGGVGITLAALWIYNWIQQFISIPVLLEKDMHSAEEAPWWLWGLALLLVDFFYYWFHRKAHEIRILWASHITHHSSEEFNLSVALRQCLFQRIFEYPFFWPMALLGIPWELFFINHGILKLYQFWVHTRWIPKLGWLEYIMLTPSQHRVHHARDPRYIDKNHGGILCIWDRMFGSFVEEQEEPHYGLTSPLKSMNPLWASLHGYTEIARDLWNTKGLMNRFGVLFNAPGWRPGDQGGPILPQPVDPGYQKYNPELNQNARLYVIIQFIAILVSTLLALRLARDPDAMLVFRICIPALAVISLTTLGIFNQSGKHARLYEIIRHILQATMTWLAFSFAALHLNALLIILIGNAIGFVHLLFIKKLSP